MDLLILFEHKSYSEPLIALQLLRYMVRIWEQALKQGETLLPVLSRSKFQARRRSAPQGGFALTFDRRSETGSEQQNWIY